MPNAAWDITSKCNLLCKHCYNSYKYFNSNCFDLSYDEALNVLCFLEENGFEFLSLLGGEPLLHPNIKDILAVCKDKGLKVAITTNGMLLDDNMIDAITESSVVSVMVSIEGGDPLVNDSIRGDGVFNQVTTNISKFANYIREKNSGISLSIAYTMSLMNVKSSREMIILCKDLNIGYLKISYAFNAGEASENWSSIGMDYYQMLNATEELIEFACQLYPNLVISIDSRPLVIWYLRRKYPFQVIYTLDHSKCQVLDKFIYITANGNLHPCVLYDMEFGRKAQEHGYFDSRDTFNIKSVKSVDEVYNSKYYKDFLSSMMRLKKDQYHTYCGVCPVRADCDPCSYQFHEGVPDCDWAVRGLEQLVSQAKSWVVTKKVSPAGMEFDKALFNTMIVSFCEYCRYKTICSQCPLGIPCNSYAMCIFALNEIRKRFSSASGKKIIKSNDYTIRAHAGSVFLTNFKHKLNILLCKDQDGAIDTKAVYNKTLSVLSDTISDSDHRWDFIFNVLSSHNKGVIYLTEV